MCCGGVWHTEPGDCCGGSWFQAPEGESLPSPPAWFVWQTDQCPEGYVYARWGFSPLFGAFTGACCGCVPEMIFDQRAGDPPGSGGMVPLESVIAEVCCDPCEPIPYLRTSEWECLGVCCAGDECSRLLPSQCNTWSHPTHPGLWESFYYWNTGCCDSNACFTECCTGGELLQQVTFEVAGDPEGGGTWKLTIPGCSGEYIATGGPGKTLEDIAQELRNSLGVNCTAVWLPDGAYAPGSLAPGTVTVIGLNVEDGTIRHCPGDTALAFDNTGYPWGHDAAARVTATDSGTGAITAVQITNAGGGYAELDNGDPSLPPIVGSVSVVPPATGSGAVLLAVIDEDTGSPTFGSIIGVTIQDGGAGYFGEDDCVTSGPASTTNKILSSLCRIINNGQLLTPTSGPCPCRPGGRCLCPPGEPCCETATSSGTGLTFSKPGEIAGTVRVTVTGTTTSPILVHGTLKGASATPERRCPFSHTFLLCFGTFNIEPVPCGSTFHKLEVEVCYEALETNTESFEFSGCNGITVYLGACTDGCVTTMTYGGPGATSNASVLLTGDGVIEANGAGPLILTGNGGFFGDIRPMSPCVEWLTLAGTSTAPNEISGVIVNQGWGVPLGVRKTGPGTWWLTGNSRYTGGLRILDGTVIVSSVPDGFYTGPLGTEWAGARVGDPGATSGTAALLATAEFSNTVRIEPTGGSQVAVLGGYGSGSPRYTSFADVLLGGDVTLQASTGGTVEFDNVWRDINGGFAGIGATTPAFNFTIGSNGNAGTVILDRWIPVPTTSVHVRYGTLVLDYQDAGGATIWRTTPVTVGDTGTSVTMAINGIDQPLSDLTLQGSGSDITGPSGGILRLVDSPAVTVTGTGHEISAAVALDDDATFDGTGSLLISGVVSGASGVTMDGSGTVSLSGNNTYTGTTTINSGTMKADSLTAFGTGAIVVNAGGTLNKNGYALANTITNNGGTVIN